MFCFYHWRHCQWLLTCYQYIDVLWNLIEVTVNLCHFSSKLYNYVRKHNSKTKGRQVGLRHKFFVDDYHRLFPQSWYYAASCKYKYNILTSIIKCFQYEGSDSATLAAANTVSKQVPSVTSLQASKFGASDLSSASITFLMLLRRGKVRSPWLEIKLNYMQY